MDSVFGTKTFLMEIYWQQRAYAIYQCRTRQGIYVPYSVTVECLDGSGDFAGKHYSDIADAIYAIEHQRIRSDLMLLQEHF